jgi:protein involved in ribonucleotide reduction
MGKVPETTKIFLENNKDYIVAVACSGNKLWGDSYCKAGDIISEDYNVPCILKFELSGLEVDVREFVIQYKKILEVY